jgi:hypothetical protein
LIGIPDSSKHLQRTVRGKTSCTEKRRSRETYSGRFVGKPEVMEISPEKYFSFADTWDRPISGLQATEEKGWQKERIGKKNLTYSYIGIY